jgi:aerobic carbon-monoxide dehydrogenase medium subunit
VVVGAVSPKPVVVNTESLVRGQKLTSDLIEEIARNAAEAVDPIEDLRGPADYKRQVVRVIVRRALTTCATEGNRQ